jgi:hypothetical protein
MQVTPPLVNNQKDEIMRYLSLEAQDIFKGLLYWGDISDFVTELRQRFNKYKQETES